MKRKLPKAKMKYGRAEKLFSSSRLEVGDTGPDFTGLTKDMASFELYRQGRDRLKIINSITSIDTKGGLRQIAEFNRLIPRAKDDIFTVNICSDLPFAIERFCNGESTSLGQLVSDYKNMDFGKKYGYETEDSRLLTSGVVVLDRKNKVIFIQYMKNPDMSPDFERALAAAEKTLYDEALLDVDKLLYE